MFDTLIKRAAPVALASLALAGCDMDINFGSSDGVPLAELDMTGDAPRAVALYGPDTLIITEGDTLNVTVEGDEQAVAALRFDRDGDTLGVMRDGEWKDTGKATVRITMPAPREIDMAGSGTINAATMAEEAEINSAGSGQISVGTLTAKRLEISMAGSGTVRASGSAERLEISIAGSGDTELDGLTADRAEVSIAGSGDVRFASDGEVEASIAGSGDVRVVGTAKCEVSSMGSGKVTCGPAQESDEEAAPAGGEEDQPAE
jgi:hypothetical protein